MLIPWENLEANIERIPFSGCWIWLAGTSNSYGSVRQGNTVVRAHRAVYEAYKGPIPAGLDALHTCDIRLCVNPDHIYLGTDSDNTRDRMERHPYYNQPLSDLCPQGHLMAGDNLAYYRGTRYCRTCKRARYRAWYAETGRPNR